MNLNEMYVATTKCILNGIRNDLWDETPSIKCGNLEITQFSETAFDSDYKCFCVKNMDNGAKIVAKVTSSAEGFLLQELKECSIEVPTLYSSVKFNPNTEKGNMIFEEFFDGEELYIKQEEQWWKRATSEISKVHCMFWNGNNIEKLSKWKAAILPNAQQKVQDKIVRAIGNVSHNSRLESVAELAVKCISDAPTTLIHGDMFPTNVLINDSNICLIDWADASISPYMMDIARLTSIVKQDGNCFCPCPDAVFIEYYKKCKPVLKKVMKPI